MKILLFNKIKQKLNEKFENFFNDKIKDETLLEEIKKILIEADISTDFIEKIIKDIKKSKITSFEQLKNELFIKIKTILKTVEKKLVITKDTLFIILIIGPNGVGKTTTTVKLANIFKKDNKNVMIVAGDTYRAAAIEQLEYLCKKNEILLFKQHAKADSASVIFDSINVAKNKNIDILIADTSGRLHTNEKLMHELKKINATIRKIQSTAPEEVILVIDSNFGQNIIKQVEKYNEFIKITGIIISKTDHTAKCGAVLSLIKTGIPILYTCNGENVNDIEVFNSDSYIKKLLDM